MKGKVKPLATEVDSSIRVSEGPVSIRNDLWTAFKSTEAKLPIRVYDTVKDKAERLATPPEREAGGELRKKRFIPIEPIPSEEQKKWAKLFVKQIKATSPQIAKECQKVFSKERWYSRFLNQLGQDPHIKRKWDAFESKNVLLQIHKWIKKNGLTLDPTKSQPRAGAITQSQESSEIYVKIIRQRLIRAIEQMPLDELVSLKIPVGYIL